MRTLIIIAVIAWIVAFILPVVLKGIKAKKGSKIENK